MDFKQEIRELKRDLHSINLLTKVDVVVKKFGISRGTFVYENGDLEICVSEINPYRVTRGIRGPAKAFGIEMSAGTSFKEVLAHEYGHAYSLDKFINNRSVFIREYKSLFGDIDSDEASYFDEEIHITKYAAKSPDEDFAECFMCFFLLHEFDIDFPGKKYSNGVYHKMKFIESISKKKAKKRLEWGKVKK